MAVAIGMTHLGGPHRFYDLSLEEQLDAMAFHYHRKSPAKATGAQAGPVRTGAPDVDAFLARLAAE